MDCIEHFSLNCTAKEFTCIFFQYIQGKTYIHGVIPVSLNSVSQLYTFNCVLMHLHQNHVWEKYNHPSQQQL